MKLLLYVLVGMGVAFAIAWVLSRKKREEQKRARERERTVTGANVTNDITRVGKGGVVKIPPFGSLRAPIETYVKKRHRYSEDGGRPWYELVCEHGTRELLVEWSREGGETYITAGFEDENPSLEDLGLTEDDLVRFDDDERGTFDWDGVTWRYVESGERDYFDNDGRERDSFYAWEFTDKAQSRYISVEKWPGDPDFEVYHLWLVDARAIEVYDAGSTS